ncbi:MAG TPA: hypothetical protein VN436_01970 [Holophaga sp.]|nr:hypothetical protein [Holophaga sp.]
METNVIDCVTERLAGFAARSEDFERRYGPASAELLASLPALFRLLHRLTFDLDVPAEHRRKAASVAVYIAESHDFLGESNRGADGLLDDLWLAYACLNQLLALVPAEQLARHWLSAVPFARIQARAARLREVEAHVPPRVLALLQTFLA